jgi:hypothetical protein
MLPADLPDSNDINPEMREHNCWRAQHSATSQSQVLQRFRCLHALEKGVEGCDVEIEITVNKINVKLYIFFYNIL